MPITKKDLTEHAKKQNLEKKTQERQDKKTLSDEVDFIERKNFGTVKDLDKREIELQDLIKRKQERSKKEF